MVKMISIEASNTKTRRHAKQTTNNTVKAKLGLLEEGNHTLPKAQHRSLRSDKPKVAMRIFWKEEGLGNDTHYDQASKDLRAVGVISRAAVIGEPHAHCLIVIHCVKKASDAIWVQAKRACRQFVRFGGTEKSASAMWSMALGRERPGNTDRMSRPNDQLNGKVIRP